MTPQNPTLADFYRRQVSNPAHGDHWAGPAEMVDRIAEALGTRSDHRVLDVGCGVGGPARRLTSATGCRVVGVDLLADVLLRASGEIGSGPAFTAADAADLPFAGGRFDELWCLGVVAHVTDVPAFASEAARVLRPTGAAVVTEALWDGRRPPRFRRTAPQPWQPVTASTLVDALGAAGFEEVELRSWPAPVSESTGDSGLDADLADGRLAPAMVVARGPTRMRIQPPLREPRSHARRASTTRVSGL